MARNGKIARLPRHIRDQLNCRLDDGESGVHLAEWLNALPEVRQVLEQDFAGRPINEQNLTEWKQGGFLTWVRDQDSREWVHLVAGEADRIAEEGGFMPLSDRLSPTVAITLGKVMHGISAESLADPETGKHLLKLFTELARLRRADHEAARLRMELGQYERKKAEQQKDDLESARRTAEREIRERAARENAAIIEEANRRCLFRSRGSSSKQPKAARPLKPSSASSPLVVNQAESNQIKPNQADCAERSTGVPPASSPRIGLLEHAP
jgi:hypothetical protein